MGSIKSFLVVDDNPEIRDSLEGLLSQLNCTVITAENGYRAIEQVREEDFDVILLDVKMPGIDGITTAENIKKEKKNAFIILMTAFSIEKLAEQALIAGVDGVIIKPFDVQSLLSQLAKKREATLYFSMLERLWRFTEESLGPKTARSLFESVLKKGITREPETTYLERTGDGIFVNRFGENGGSIESPAESDLEKKLEIFLSEVKSILDRTP